MAEIKDYTNEEKQQTLKGADSHKTVKDTTAGAGLRAELFGTRKMTERAIGSNVKVKKKLPIAIDIIAGLLMLVLVCAVIIGSYLLFRYFSNDYDGVELEYTLSFDVEGELDTYASLKSKELFMDVTGNSVYFGKITGVETVEDEADGVGGKVILTVKANVKHRDGEGYSIGNSRLAVGSKYASLRCGEINIANALVTELTLGGK